MTYKNGAVIVALGETAMGEESNIDIVRNLYSQRDDWLEEYESMLAGIDLEIENPVPHTIVFNAGTDDEMLKITPDGFYVRGVQVEQDANEAEAVYKAFKEFMTWAIISKPE